ncbi:hypothetical protein SAMN06269185_0708 [Natronoarchaeum philippinense]|uniref:Cell division protein A N-terminal domain-containing protein n=1 Tax=Natronoarchaeum philippinense TaxID=558529 RepID=A0A285N7N1_NATPI|nr:permease [Natronoarchaeum philippinense]SNZ04877.1 hypothetical protein SAMN06269185_0708 [Natronoarchaeum philippinense]
MTDDETGDLPDNKLFELYEQYLGEPDAETDVYLGFGLFFVGIAFAVIALGLFAWSGAFVYGTDGFWSRRAPAFALGMLSVPTLLLSLVVLLPVERRATVSGLGGWTITLLSVVAFWQVYPSNWNVAGATDYSIQVTAVYAVGMTVLTASTGAALIAHQLARARPGPADIEPVDDEDEEETTYTTEEIEADIENAMEGVDLSWGGVEKHESKRLEFSTDTEFEAASVDGEATTTRESGGVDAQVSGLRQLKGGEKKTQTSESTVDDQTNKLKELREQRRKEEAADDGDDGLAGSIGGSGLLQRLRSALGR